MRAFREQNHPAAIRLIRSSVPYTGPFERLPHGPHSLDAAQHQRLRIYQSYAELLREPPAVGAITVSRIGAKARVSRRAFYEHFANRQECFRRLEALARGLQAKRREHDAEAIGA